MNTRVLKPTLLVCCIFLFILMVAGSACLRVDTNANTNANANLMGNANTAPVNANANLSPETVSSIAAREPEKYRATLVFSAETEGGQKTIGIPTLSADVARNGADRRVSFKLSDGSDLIYLEQGDTHLVVAPGRKQYAELTPEATGIQLQKLMTPGQLVTRLEKLKGVEHIGQETINGRVAEKYRYAKTTNTNTQAGSVSTEGFIYLDKDTGLPLRSELFAEASGNVQGVKGARIVAEMRDISTDVDASYFQVPAGFNKVPPAQVRQQIDALTNMASALIKALLSSGSPQVSPAPTVSPAVASSPSP